MSGGEIALLVGVCVAFAVAVGVIVYNKIKGKSSCDCGGACGACGSHKKSACDGCCSHCAMTAVDKNDDEKHR